MIEPDERAAASQALARSLNDDFRFPQRGRTKKINETLKSLGVSNLGPLPPRDETDSYRIYSIPVDCDYSDMTDVTLGRKRFDEIIPLTLLTEHSMASVQILACQRSRDIILQYYCTSCKEVLSFDLSNVRKHLNNKHSKSEQTKHMRAIAAETYLFLRYRPLSEAEDELFLAAIGDIPLPGRKALRSQLDRYYEEMTVRLTDKLSSGPGFSLVLDEWTHYGIKFLGLVAITIDSIYLLSLTNPFDLNRTAAVIKSEFENRLNELNVRDQVIIGVSDCAASMRKAVTSSGLKWFPCACHIINSAFKELCQFFPVIATLESRVNTLRDTNTFRQFLRQQEAPLTTICSYSPTRWLSLSQTLSDIISLEGYIKLYQNTVTIQNKHLYPESFSPFTPADFIEIQSIAPIVSQISRLVAQLEEEDCNAIFYALEKLMVIQEDITQSMIHEGFVEQAAKLKNGIKSRLLKYNRESYLNLLVAATILNPCLDVEQVLPPDMHYLINDAMDWIREQLPRDRSAAPPPAVSSIPNLTRGRINIIARSADMDDLDRYMMMKRRPTCTSFDCFHSLPDLERLVKKLKTIPPSSSSVERCFSRARSVLPYKMGASKPDTINKRMVLYLNPTLAVDVIAQLRAHPVPH